MVTFNRTFGIKNFWIVILTAVVLMAGTLSTITVIHSAENRQKQALLSRVEIIAASIGIDGISGLTGTPSDIDNPQYKKLKKTISHIKATQDDIRFVYLMGYHSGNQLFFYADSEDPSSVDYSAPGDVYYDTNRQEMAWYQNGSNAIEGPLKDSWGDWVSAFAPILDPSTKKTAAMVGIDVKASLWKENITREALVPLVITLSVLLLLFISFFFIKKIERYVGDLNLSREKIFQNEHQLEVILESLPVGVLLFSVPEGRLIMANRAAVNIFSKKPPFQQKFTEYFRNSRITYENGADYPIEELPVALTLKTGNPNMKKDMIVHTSQSENINLKVTAVPIKNSQQELSYVAMVTEDMTKEHNIKDMESELVSITSHQLRAPLISIRWFCELLLSQKTNGNFTEQQKDFLEQIYASNKRMIALVNNLLDVSHIESKNKFAIEKELVKLSDILDPVMSEQSIIAKMKQSEIISYISKEDEVMLMADAQKLYQVFQNLINNAIKYSPNHSIVEVGLKREGTLGIFYVKDSGLGVPKQQQGRIFDKFFRAENVLEIDTNGTGLGLYIVKAIVEAHGGKIWFESEEGKGTTFYFELPIVPNNQ